VLVKSTNKFKISLLKLAKKDKQLFDEVEELIETLHKKDEVGTHIGNGRYKIRLKNNSNNKGKSVGYRVITYTKIENTILLVYIYSKSKEESVSSHRIDDIIYNYKIDSLEK